ncbi:hypothetical protein FRB99_008600 [Tulasnella sp. 403]|nr:hypothetical protein FRB99_008600 [Tulasnella sp. 403]
MHFYFYCAPVVLLSVVRAALYPTDPVGSTTYPAGQDVVIRWKDDDNEPHLGQLGYLRIDLFVGDDSNLVSTLADNIRPMDRAARIRIEKYFGVDGSDYYIRFTPSDDSVAPIYTSKFTITGLTGSASYRQNSEDDTSDSGSNAGEKSSSDDMAAAIQGVGNGTTSISTISTASRGVSTADATSAISVMSNGFSVSGSVTILASTSRATITPTPTSTNIPFNPASVAAQPTLTYGSDKNSAAGRFQRPSDGGLGTMGLMYLLWPFLMGVAMAL